MHLKTNHRIHSHRRASGNNRLIPLVAGMLATAAGVSPAFAQEAQGEVAQNVAEGKPTAEGSASVAWRAARGLSLAREAREQRSVTMMIAAVEVLRGVDLRTASLGEPEEVAQEEQTPSRPSPKAADDVQPHIRAADMLAEARIWAGDDEVLLALIDRATERLNREGASTMGRTRGPAADIKRVEGRSKHVFREQFRGGELARIVVIGDGDTDIDLFIYDAGGNLIRRDTRLTDFVHVEWTPRWTGEFRIEVVNNGNVWNRYVIVMS